MASVDELKDDVNEIKNEDQVEEDETMVHESVTVLLVEVIHVDRYAEFPCVFSNPLCAESIKMIVLLTFLYCSSKCYCMKK